MADPVPPAGAAVPRLARRFWPVWLAAAAGVLALLLQPVPLAVLQATASAGASEATVRLLLLVNPLLLATLMALAGATVAHRVGFTSHLAATRRGHFGWALPAAAGIGTGVLLALADAVLTPALGRAWQEFLAGQGRAPLLPALAVGVLYGGLTEEVMMRWGLMSLVASLLARTSSRWRRDPGAGLPSWVAWIAIVVAALLFAAGHLPALAQLAEPTPALVGRTLALNLAAGVLYGWLFWRRGLEAAMLGHACTHAGLAGVRLVLG